MPIFISLCLLIAALVEFGSQLQKMLTNPDLVYVGLGISVVAIAANYFKKLPEMLTYDIFSSGALLTWFALWKPLFVKDSPIFFFFPIYFALITALAYLFFISQRHTIDNTNLSLMRSIDDKGVAEPWLVMSLVLVTLYFDTHFLQYPVFMTLLTIRYTLTGCLLPSENSK